MTKSVPKPQHARRHSARARVLNRELTEATPEVRLLAIGVRDLDPDVLVCIEAGAVGYVVRPLQRA